jgi:hypothetical protein
MSKFRNRNSNMSQESELRHGVVCTVCLNNVSYCRAGNLCNAKGKICSCAKLIKHYVTKMYGVVYIHLQINTLLILALFGCKFPPSHLLSLYIRGKNLPISTGQDDGCIP